MIFGFKIYVNVAVETFNIIRGINNSIILMNLIFQHGTYFYPASVTALENKGSLIWSASCFFPFEKNVISC